MAKLNTGDRNEAQRLIKRGMLLYPEPWLLAKAQAKLKNGWIGEAWVKPLLRTSLRLLDSGASPFKATAGIKVEA